MKVLVTGANGQLGTSIRNSVASSSNLNDEYIFTDVDELDITDQQAVDKFVKDNDIKVIINCAAYTNVDRAEDDKDLAELLNAAAPRILADAIKSNNGTLIHISTDYVFGGNTGNTPRSENESVNPTGVYGLTKLHGEQEIADSGVKALIFRTAWLYSEYGKNFVKTMLNLTQTKPELKVVFDQVGTPTYARDLADAIFMIVNDRKFEGNEGIYHYSNEGVCSWYDFTKMIQMCNANTDCNVLPCHSDEFPSKVVRPAYSVLDKEKFKRTFGLKIPYWVDSLRSCMVNLSENSK